MRLRKSAALTTPEKCRTSAPRSTKSEGASLQNDSVFLGDIQVILMGLVYGTHFESQGSGEFYHISSSYKSGPLQEAGDGCVWPYLPMATTSLPNDERQLDKKQHPSDDR